MRKLPIFRPMLFGYFASFLFVLLLTIGIFCFGYAAKKSSVLLVLLLETLLGVVFILPILILSEGLSMPALFAKPAYNNWLWLSAAAVFGFGGGNYFSLLNLKTAGEKINSLLSPAITAVTVLLFFFVFGEKLRAAQWLGVAITLFAVAAFLVRKPRAKTSVKRSLTGAWSGVAAVVFISLAVICSIRGANEQVSILHAVWIRLLVALVLIALVFFSRGEKLLVQQDVKFYMALLIGVLAQTVLANYLWYYAFYRVGVSVFQTIIATLPLCVYAVDVYLLKKSKPSLLFLVASFIAVAGICLVML